MRGRALALGACVFAGSFTMLASATAQQNPNDPEITITPSSKQSFGVVCIGASSGPRTFRIDNDAESGAELSVGISVIGPDKNDFHASSLTPSPAIAPGGHSTVSVTFVPGGRGTRDATLRVTSNDPNEGTTDIDLTGEGRDRKLTSDRASVSFGEQRVGTRSPTQTLLVRNPGQDPVTITNIRRVGNHPRDFRVSFPSVPFSIAAGDFVSFTLAFQPTGPGLRNATLEISSNACGKPKLSIPLVGSGAVSKVLVDPNPIDVGSAAVDAQGPPVAVTVSNAGGAPLKITAVQVVGTNAEDFVLEDLPTMPATIPVAESFIFHVRMTPTAEGARAARINILSDDPGAPTFAVDLRGTGGKASASPTASASASASASPTPTKSATAARSVESGSNDNLAVILVIAAVLLAFAGLVVVRRFIAVRDDDE